MKKHLIFTLLVILCSTFRMFSQLPASPTLATANVPEASQYGVLYQLNIGNSGTYSNLAAINYSVNNSALTLNYTKVAYFLQLDNKWIWLSMNKFNTTNAQLGIPHQASGISFQQTVTGMNVYSSANAGVTNTLNANGNIEIWPNCYNTGLGLAGIGGNANTYDFNDLISANSTCYGSFQFHNYGAQQTLLAFNSFNNNNAYDLGIGNSPTGHPDFTFEANGGIYTTKKLWILVNNGVYIVTPPSVANVTACTNGTVTPLTLSAGVNSGSITTYQWYSNTVNSNTGGTLVATNNSTTTSNTYTPSTTTSNVRYFYCIVSGSNGSTAKSEVSGAITIASPIVSLTGASTICAGKSLTLTASSFGAVGTYTWSTGANTATTSVAPNSTTNYTVSFTNSGGCVGTSTIATVNVNPLPVLGISGSSAICVGQTATLIASGANTYTWNTSSTATSITSSPATNTTYSVNGTSLLGCTGSVTSALAVNPNPVVTVNNGAICVGQSFTINPNGASTYSVQGGNLVVGPTSNASYSVIGTSVDGCISQSFAISNVTVNPNPIITVNSGTICEGQAFTINPNGASTYTVQGGNLVVNPMSNTSYSVIGTSAAGCLSQTFATSSVTVNVNPTITVNSGAICVGQNFTINPSGASTYTVQGGNMVVNPTSNASYTVLGANSVGCVAQAFVTSSVVVNQNPVITVNSGAICEGQSFTLTPNGASTYSVQGGNLVVSPISNASFSVVGTSSAGCVSQSFATSNVTVNPNPIVTVNSGAICQGQAFTINPNGASTYTVQGGNLVVNPTSNTSYTVRGTSAAGCLSQTFATSSVTVNANPTITVNSGAICVGQNFTINPSGASTYTVQGGNMVVNPTSNASYTVLGTNSVGCVAQAFVTSSVVVNQNPVITVNSGAICEGQSFTLTPNGASTYSVQGGNLVVSPVSNASFSVVGTSTAGCVSQSFATSNVTVNPNPIVTVNSGAICQGQAFTINPNGASTYTVQGGNLVVNPTSNTSYTVRGTSAAGCLSQTFATSSVTVNANPTITVNSGAICVGQNFTIIPFGASTYTVQGGNMVISPTTNNTYTVVGTNTAGCVSPLFASSSVTVNNLPVVSVNGSNSLCAGGSVSLTAGGANTYTWSTTANTASVNVSPSLNTTYSVTGSSTAGCVGNTATLAVTVNTLPVIAITGTNALCAGASATLTGAGATTYTWNTASNSNSITVTPALNTTYSLNGRSPAGCAGNTATFAITVNPNPALTITGASGLCTGQTASLTANGASTYSWNTGSTNSLIVVSPTSNSTYSVTGTSPFGCTSFTSQLVTVQASLSISVTGPTVVCNGQTAQLAGLGGVTYTWNTGATTATIAPTITTTTTFSVLGASGTCSNTAVFTVAVNQNPTVTITGSTTICAGGTTTMIATGATNYSWTSGASSASVALSPTATANYSVTGTNSTGCSNTKTTSVTVYSLPVLTISGNNVICEGDTTLLTVSGANSYLWNTTSTSNTLNVNPIATATYTALGTSTNGCIGTSVRTVTVNSRPVITLSSTTPICAGDSKTITANGASTYSWSTGATGNMLVITPSITAGNYTFNVKGTSTAGCAKLYSDSILVNALPSLTITGGNYVCNGNVLNLDATGALTYSWSNGAISNSVAVTPSVNTSYSVTGTSVEGCTNTAVNDVTVVAFPSVIITGDSTLCYGDSITLVATGANSYTWSTGSTNSLVVIQPTASTTYSLIGAIGLGCSDTTQTNIIVKALPSLSLSLNSTTICLGEETTISIAGASTYTWNTTATSASISVSPSITTTYSVTATGSNSCLSEKSLTLTVNECLSINKQNFAAQTSVYPNPTNGNFTIEMPVVNGAEIRIVNVFGQNMFSLKAKESNKIDLSAYDKGMYFIYVMQDNAIVYKKVMIKN